MEARERRKVEVLGRRRRWRVEGRLRRRVVAAVSWASCGMVRSCLSLTRGSRQHHTLDTLSSNRPRLKGKIRRST